MAKETKPHPVDPQDDAPGKPDVSTFGGGSGPPPPPPPPDPPTDPK